MRYTLMSHDEVLGYTGAELTGLLEETRGWHFLPAPAFERVGPILLELQHATDGLQELAPDPASLAQMREEERPAFVRNAIMSDPGAARFLELMDIVEELALELRDEEGAVYPTRTLGVTELALSPEAFRDVLAAIDPDADPALSARPPFYLVVAGL